MWQTSLKHQNHQSNHSTWQETNRWAKANSVKQLNFWVIHRKVLQVIYRRMEKRQLNPSRRTILISQHFSRQWHNLKCLSIESLLLIKHLFVQSKQSKRLTEHKIYRHTHVIQRFHTSLVKNTALRCRSPCILVRHVKVQLAVNSKLMQSIYLRKFRLARVLINSATCITEKSCWAMSCMRCFLSVQKS